MWVVVWKSNCLMDSYILKNKWIVMDVNVICKLVYEK